MQYVMIIYEKPGSLQSLTDAERQQVANDYYALNSDPRVTAGLWMKPADMATAVRVRGSSPLVTDGPFADSKEVIGGYFVLQADNIDQAIEIAARIPQARLGGGVEIRPTVEAAGLIDFGQIFRDEWSRVLAALIGYLGDFERAEDAAQEAFAVAAERWPVTGIPANPGGWLLATARNRAIDRIRRDRTLAAKIQLLEPLPDVQGDDPPLEDSVIPDERLEFIFMCCHPALAREAQVALTLRAVGGLSTDEIARAFLVAPETMKRRLSRARAKISGAGIPFGRPAPERLEDRLAAAVVAVVYLIFNEGYGGRGDLAGEAIRLGRLVAQLLPSQPEAHGLLAMMLCHDARRQARYAGDELVLLADQDRALWDMDQIDAGREVLRRALAMGGRGPYVLQAAIAVLQTEAEIDWSQVAALYTELAELTRSPVVELNRAVAVAQAGAPEAALRIVEGLPLEEYPYLHSTRADLLRRLGRSDEARRAYRQALERSHAEPERRFLQRRLAELDD